MGAWRELATVRGQIRVLLRQLGKAQDREKKLVASCQHWLIGMGPVAKPTPAETRVIDLLIQDPTLLNKQIADKLGISLSATKMHMRHIMQKFQVQTRYALIQSLQATPKRYFKRLTS